MLKEIKTRPVMCPQPVFVVGTYDADGTPDAMTVSWAGQNWMEMVEMNISADHKTTENMRLQKAFTLHLANKERVELADYLGIVSGKEKGKINHVNATIVKGRIVNAPIIEEFLLAMECNVISMEDNGRGGVYVVAQVVRTVADDTIIDTDGKIMYSRLNPIMADFETDEYLTIGKTAGKVYSIGKNLK